MTKIGIENATNELGSMFDLKRRTIQITGDENAGPEIAGLENMTDQIARQENAGPRMSMLDKITTSITASSLSAVTQ